MEVVPQVVARFSTGQDRPQGECGPAIAPWFAWHPFASRTTWRPAPVTVGCFATCPGAGTAERNREGPSGKRGGAARFGLRHIAPPFSANGWSDLAPPGTFAGPCGRPRALIAPQSAFRRESAKGDKDMDLVATSRQPVRAPASSQRSVRGRVNVASMNGGSFILAHLSRNIGRSAGAGSGRTLSTESTTATKGGNRHGDSAWGKVLSAAVGIGVGSLRHAPDTRQVLENSSFLT